MTDITLSILALKPGAQVVVRGDSADNITWMDGNPTNITKEAILAKKVELQAEFDAQEYARNRAAEYPTVADFMEAYTEKEIGDDSTKWDAYVTKYNKVRTDNPKP